MTAAEAEEAAKQAAAAGAAAGEEGAEGGADGALATEGGADGALAAEGEGELQVAFAASSSRRPPYVWGIRPAGALLAAFKQRCTTEEQAQLGAVLDALSAPARPRPPARGRTRRAAPASQPNCFSRHVRHAASST